MYPQVLRAPSSARHRNALLGALILACGTALAQRDSDVATPGSTVLAPAFADKLSLNRIGWPGAAEQERAHDAHTDAARFDAVRWLTRLLSREYWPFDPGAREFARHPLGQVLAKPEYSTRAAIEYGRRLTAAISDDGDDLLCARWSTPTYQFQFIGAQDLIRLSVEPASPGSRGHLTAEQAVARVQDFLRRLLNDSTRLLNFCTLRAEATPCGYCVRVHCNDIEAWGRQFDPDEENELYHRWALHLMVHTDGVSFVLDVKPMTSVNVVGAGGRPVQRWFHPARSAVVPRATTAPAQDPNEALQKLEALERKLRERECRDGEQSETR